MKNTILLALIFFTATASQGQNTASERCAAFGKGMNLSNWLEAGWQSGWPTANGYSKTDLQLMKEAGIQSLRLPVCFALITDSVAPYTIDTNHLLFTRIDTVLQWATELHMNLIIDNHHEWSLASDNWRNNEKRFAHLWAYLANRYKNTDPRYVTLELLNEPALLFPIDSLNVLFATAIDSIRKYNTAHTIIVSPSAGSSGMAFDNYQPMPDTNLIYTWHCYDPINFTHQGFTWGNPTYPSGTLFPSTPTTFYETFLYTAIARVNQWKATYQKPVFLGEFGVSEWADETSRCNWISLMGQNLDTHQIPWFYWDWRWDFSMFRSHVVSADSVVPCFAHALHLYSDTLSSISETENDAEGINLYPNPVSKGEVLSLAVKASVAFQCKIFDATGRLLKEKVFAAGENTMPLDLMPGLYLVEITTTKEKRLIRKLVCN